MTTQMVGTSRRIWNHIETRGTVFSKSQTTLKTTAKSIAEVLGVSTRTVRRHRDRLVANGLLSIKGSHITQTWTIARTLPTFYTYKVEDNYLSRKGIFTPKKTPSEIGIDNHTHRGIIVKRLLNVKTLLSTVTVNTVKNVHAMFNKAFVYHKRISLGRLVKRVEIRLSLQGSSIHSFVNTVNNAISATTIARFLGTGDEMERSEAPSLPTYVREISSDLVFPLKRIAKQSSAIWYWALLRWKTHGLDFRFTASNFRQMALKYSRALNPVFGKDWEKHKEYIEWYLRSEDYFIRNRTEYGFEFMVSTACYNNYLIQKDKAALYSEFFEEDPEVSNKPVKKKKKVQKLVQEELPWHYDPERGE